MLDSFDIISTSGVVLWSKNYVPVSRSILNGLINDVFIEETVHPGAGVAGDGPAAKNPTYQKERYSLKWTTAKDLGLIFVVRTARHLFMWRSSRGTLQAVYQSILHLSWVDKLLDNVKTLFVSLYGAQLKKPNSITIECNFDPYFDQQIRELSGVDDPEAAAARVVTAPGGPPPIASEPAIREPLPPVPSFPNPLAEPARQYVSASASADASPNVTPNTSRPVTPSGHLLTAANGPRTSRRAKKAAREVSQPPSADESKTKGKGGKAKAKGMRKWDAEGNAMEDDDQVLDYSAPTPEGDGASSTVDSQLPQADDVDPESFGTRTKKGQFILKDLDDEVHSILKQADSKKVEEMTSSGLLGGSFGAISGYFKGIVGGKVLTKEDLEKPLRAMEEHLIKKNVAREAAVRLVEAVEQELVGVKTGSFESTHCLYPYSHSVVAYTVQASTKSCAAR